MYQYTCLNPISPMGLEQLPGDYVKTETVENADAILVRSASMHEMEFSRNLKAVARAGAGVNNIPLTVVPKTALWCSTRREPTPTA